MLTLIARVAVSLRRVLIKVGPQVARAAGGVLIVWGSYTLSKLVVQEINRLLKEREVAKAQCELRGHIRESEEKLEDIYKKYYDDMTPETRELFEAEMRRCGK